MILSSTVCIVVACTPQIASIAQANANGDLAALQGEWRCTKICMNGVEMRPANDAESRRMTVEFRYDSMFNSLLEPDDHAHVRVGGEGHLRELDVEIGFWGYGVYSEAGSFRLGLRCYQPCIYTLEKDKLTIRYGIDGSRPISLKLSTNEGEIVEYERVPKRKAGH